MHFIQKHAPFVASCPANAHHPQDRLAMPEDASCFPEACLPARAAPGTSLWPCVGFHYRDEMCFAWMPDHVEAKAVVAFQPAPRNQAYIARKPPRVRTLCPTTVVGRSGHCRVLCLFIARTTANACRRHEKKKRGPNATTCSAVGGAEERRYRYCCFWEMATGRLVSAVGGSRLILGPEAEGPARTTPLTWMDNKFRKNVL